MQENTISKYHEAVNFCRDIFLKKTRDYGTSWRVYRIISIVDQIYIKARRIRTIQELKTQKVHDNIAGEFSGILNYAVIGLIQLDINSEEPEELGVEEIEMMYDKKIDAAEILMQNKNHDYGDAWKEMSQESFVDLILAKLLRIKKILSNNGVTVISEGIDANLFDIINYAVFALILI